MVKNDGANLITKNNEISDNPELIAWHHNEALKYVYHTLEVSSDLRPDIVLELVKSYFTEGNFCSEEDGQIALDQVEPTFDYLFPSGGDYSSKISIVINDFAETHQLSEIFLNDLRYLINNADNYDVEQMLDYVNITMANRNYSNGDLHYFAIFEEVINASAAYWTSQLTLKSTEWKRSSWVIFNDAVGAVLGSPFGGIGGAILGAALSIGTNEGW